MSWPIDLMLKDFRGSGKVEGVTIHLVNAFWYLSVSIKVLSWVTFTSFLSFLSKLIVQKGQGARFLSE